MIVKEVSHAQEANGSAASAGAEEAIEAVHLAGSAVATGAVAILLSVIALPVSAGLGVVWGARTLARRVWKK